MPGHSLGIRQAKVARTPIDAQTSGSRGDDRRSAAVGEEKEGDESIHPFGFLQVQAAKFEIHHQHHGLGVRFDDLLCVAQTHQPSMAAHETDHSTLH
jgi:hypothetical protein